MKIDRSGPDHKVRFFPVGLGFFFRGMGNPMKKPPMILLIHHQIISFSIGIFQEQNHSIYS